MNNIFKKLSIVIPVFNEISTLPLLIDKVQETEISLEKEIIIVDDCSTDGTREILKSNIFDSNFVKIFHEKNLGKGAAIRSGFKAITGDIVLIQDADLEYSPSEYSKLLEPILIGNADVVFGSRFIGPEARRVLYFWHYLGNKFLTFFSNMFTNLNLTDMETCYKVFKADIIRKIQIEEDRFGFEPEITAKIAKLNCRIYEVGISYNGRTYKEGKKINWKDGFSAIRCILKYGI